MGKSFDRDIVNRWHLDEVRIKTNGEVYWLWRAVDDEGQVIDILMHKRRNTKAAKRLMKKLLKKQGFAPRVIVTDKLKSYGAAIKEMGFSIIVTFAFSSQLT